MIDRFTQKAREAIRLAVETAQELEHGYVGTELAWRQRFWQNMM